MVSAPWSEAGLHVAEYLTDLPREVLERRLRQALEVARARVRARAPCPTGANPEVSQGNPGATLSPQRRHEGRGPVPLPGPRMVACAGGKVRLVPDLRGFAFKIAGVELKTEVLPFAIYAIPEMSYIGETEESLAKQGRKYVVGRGRYDMNPRGQILGDLGGAMKLVFEEGSLKLLGAHIIGTGASELIHTGEAFLRTGATAQQIAETLFNYPTLSDLYRHAALKALSEQRKREGKNLPAAPG